MKLFEPVHLGALELKNRLVMPPMFSSLAEPGGTTSPAMIDYYACRARGGVGMIEVELTTVDPLQFTSPLQLRISDDSYIPSLARLARGIKENGARAAIQLHHPGRQALSRVTGREPVGPSPIPSSVNPDTPRELTVEEILGLVDLFAQAARRAVEAGFDAIELHGAHGYMLCQFLSPRSNKRTDQYGGSLENRMRFIVELVQKTIAAVPPGFPVGIRLSADEHMPDGVTLDEMKVVARKLEDLDIAYIHMSSGSYEAISWLFPGDDAIMVDEAKAFKDTVSIPIIATSIHDPKTVDKVISEGKADMVSLARAHFADPEWPNKVKAGAADDIERCRRDFYCVCRFLLGLPVRCHRNTNLGREKYMPEYWRSSGARGIEVLPRYLR